MNYNFNGKTIKIPDKEIEKSMKNLELTKDEAIEMWLEDEGYLDNDEQIELDKKAKDSKITATIHQAKDITQKKTQKERCHKENPTKEMVIAEIANLLPKFAENIEIVNKGKLITFTIGNDNFKLDLIQTRKPKEKK
jgi:antitoxin component of MazEF toxin-antitoxin module